MKNLKNKYYKDELDDIETNRTVLKKQSLRNYRRDHYPNIGGTSIWNIASLIIQNSDGKTVEEVYKKYKNKVKHTRLNKSLSKSFYDDFILSSWRYHYYGYKIIDGKIQVVKPEKNKSITIASRDYKSELVLKIDNRIKVEKVYKNYKLLYKAIYSYIFPMYKYRNKFFTENEIQQITVSGWIKTYSSRNCKEFIKYSYEERSKRRKEKREHKKALQAISYSFISKSELKLKEEKKEDLIKLVKHGFDPVTSFRTEKQTNPDLIRGL